MIKISFQDFYSYEAELRESQFIATFEDRTLFTADTFTELKDLLTPENIANKVDEIFGNGHQLRETGINVAGTFFGPELFLEE